MKSTAANLYLENPGVYIGPASGSYMLVKDLSDNSIKKFNPEVTDFASINYVTYLFNNVDHGRLSNFDTGIPADDYYVTVGGFIVLQTNGGTNINLPGNNNFSVLYESYAFVENNTWHIRFQPNHGRQFSENANLYLNVTAFRKRFLTNSNAPINIDMNGNTAGTGSAPSLPVGITP